LALLAADRQYAHESVEAKRSDVSSAHGVPGSACHQLAPPSVATSAERVGSSSRKKSTWCAYSCWTVPHENEPASSRSASI
jgi:hypothetical protein